MFHSVLIYRPGQGVLFIIVYLVPGSDNTHPRTSFDVVFFHSGGGGGVHVPSRCVRAPIQKYIDEMFRCSPKPPFLLCVPSSRHGLEKLVSGKLMPGVRVVLSPL